jgi:alkylation response protein AidB-like acyl-CoA dehydrogenase
MNFELTSEQELLLESVKRWVETKYSFAQRQKIRRLPRGFAPENWREMAELGWLALALPSDVGGLGQSTIESCIIAEELGRALVLEPFVQVGILAAQLIDLAGSPQQRANWLPGLISGERIVTVAHNEHESPGALSFVETRANFVDGKWTISGRKTLTFAADAADLLLISARTTGAADDEDGISLFGLDPAAPGLKRRDYRTVDGLHVSDVTLQNVTASNEALVGQRDRAFPAIERAHQIAITVLCAEAIGMMEQALSATCEYLRSRKQFGVQIGTFQVLQHRVADMYIETQIARAALWRALAYRRRAVASAKAQMGRVARFVCGQAIQLHGGIGVTEEFPIGHYFKRMTVFDLTFGNTQAHLKSIVRAQCRNKTSMVA